MGTHNSSSTSFLLVLCVVIFLQGCFAPPVTQNKQQAGEQHNDTEINGLEDYMEYHRYLKEVVNALESDPEFRNKLEKANEDDIRSGKIAEELEFVSHHVRNRLDEIKRVELNRLKELTERKRRLMQQDNTLEDPAHHHHVDHANPHTFEIEDLKKLIAKTTQDLAEADRQRKEEFKQYELQKEYDKQMKLNHTNGAAEREKLEREFREREEKHKKHEKLHEPGHKAQLEEVWEEQDQMQQEFDPKTFFMLHDLDSNGLWDQDEVKALFVKELEKMYRAGEPEDDMRERAEEMERMRESVFREVDLNRDGFIDFEEFLAQTKRNDFQQDHGWQGLDENRPYTDEELQQYIRQHELQQQQQQQGYYQPPPPPPGHHPQQPYYHPAAGVPPPLPPHAQGGAGYHQQQQQQQQQQHYQAPPVGGYQQQQGYHPNAIPPPPSPQQQQQQNQQQQQFHPGQVVAQHPPQAIPGQHLPDLNTNEIHPAQQQQHHPNQIPNAQQQYQQPPQGQQYHQQQQQQQQNVNQQQQFQGVNQQQQPSPNQQPNNQAAPPSDGQPKQQQQQNQVNNQNQQQGSPPQVQVNQV